MSIRRVSIHFSNMRKHCKYHRFAYNEDRYLIDTCRHEMNIPSGCSWGECSSDMCPILNGCNEEEE